LKAIVTGGAGFIGCSLVKKLINEFNYEVLVVDSLTYASQKDSLSDVWNNDLFSFEKADISDQRHIKNIFYDFKPNYIFNLAAETHVDRSIEEPKDFVMTNILGTFSLLEESLNFWRSLPLNLQDNFKFLHISTDEVFGDLEDHEPPFSEENRYEPSSPYSASKASSDHLVKSWHRTYQLPILLSNCSNNYGPYQFFEKLIPLMILKALRGEKLPLYGAGDQVRDWLYVEDHVDALIKIIHDGRVGESYNVGASCEKTNLQVVELICSILDAQVESKPSNITSFSELITFVEDRPGHDKRYAINPDKINRELLWKPQVDFETGLKKTIAWYLKRVEFVDYEASRIGIGRKK
tara:strand:- start:1381 stop:2433 length:1053 start_codon:yes stop_codon:yes gene_type:complete